VLILLVLLTFEGALGVAVLHAAYPAVLSVVHQLCAIAVLAAALAPREARRPTAAFSRALPKPA
jgi:heme A synthase